MATVKPFVSPSLTYETLEEKLDNVRVERGACEARLADPAEYSEPENAMLLGQRAGELREQEDALESEWLALYAQIETA